MRNLFIIAACGLASFSDGAPPKDASSFCTETKPLFGGIEVTSVRVEDQILPVIFPSDDPNANQKKLCSGPVVAVVNFPYGGHVRQSFANAADALQNVASVLYYNGSSYFEDGSLHSTQSGQDTVTELDCGIDRLNQKQVVQCTTRVEYSTRVNSFGLLTLANN